MSSGLAAIAEQLDRLHVGLWLLAGILLYIGFISLALRRLLAVHERIAKALERVVSRLDR